VVWYGTDRRALIEADSACSDRLGNLFDLRNVHLVVYSGARRVADLYAPSGMVRTQAGQVLLTGASESSAVRASGTLSCLRHPSVISLDLGEGSMKGPGFFIPLKAPEELHCGVAL
jgi:hypothetical protein